MLNTQNINANQLQAKLEKAICDQRRLTILVVLLTLSFYASWMPYAIKSVVHLTGYDSNKAFSLVAMVLPKTGVIINPILYIFFNKSVRI